jgi:hypothetical protein
MNALIIIDRVDPRLAFLARAAARFVLVQAGEMMLDQAFDGLVDSLQCPCEREIIERWERLDRIRLKRRRK